MMESAVGLKLAQMLVTIISTIAIFLKYSAIAVVLLLAAIGANTVASLIKFNKIIGPPGSAAFKPSDLRIRRGAVSEDFFLQRLLMY